MELKCRIDQELSHITVPEHFTDHILLTAHRKSKKRKCQAAAIVLCLILAGTTASAGYFLSGQVRVNQEVLPELPPMEKKSVNESSAATDETGVYLEEYDTYQELCSDLGIDLLSSDLAEENADMLILRKTDNLNWNKLYIAPYIMGDVKNITRDPGKLHYSWESGYKFSSPVDMEIDIIISDSQLQNGWEKDFLGTYEFVETYITRQGYQADIIKDTSVAGTDGTKTHPKYCVILMADGIRYTLKGQIELEKMKEILDSLHCHLEQTESP